MSPRKLTAADLFDTLEVDLWGNVYTLRAITRSVSVKLADAETTANALREGDDQTGDAAAEAVIDLIDVLLEPMNGAVAVKELLGGMWAQDKLGLDVLTALAQGIQEEAQARRRPTSPTASSS